MWDGIKELNTPLPRWWVWLFYATIIWAVGYWVVYPAWPTLTGFTRGVMGYTNRAQVVVDLAALQQTRGANAAVLAQADLGAIEKDPMLLALARAQGKAAFGNNCAACHGIGATGSKGYPNLNDDDWLWGGTLDQIYQTVRYGVRSGHPEAHQGDMPAFGKQALLKPGEIVAVANYVLSLSGLPVRAGVDLNAGRKIFADNCAVCHGEQGKGNPEVGSPNLTDKIWLYGPEEATIIDGITNGRGAVMPAWIDRLDPATLKAPSQSSRNGSLEASSNLRRLRGHST